MKDAILPNDGPINLFPPIRGLCDSVGAHRRRYLFRRRHGWWPTETGFHGENWKDWEKCRGIFLRRENSNRIEINWYFYVKYLIFLFTLYFQIWIWEGGPKRPARDEMEKVEGEAEAVSIFWSLWVRLTLEGFDVSCTRYRGFWCPRSSTWF